VFSYGFDIDASTGNAGGGVGTVAVAAYPGADPSQAGQSQSVNMNDMPLLNFSGNEVYGATQSGMTLWWIGTYGDNFYSDAQVSVVNNFVAWNFSTRGFYGYPTNNVTIQGMVIRGDESQVSNPYLLVTGINFDDYMTRNLVIQNVDIQGMATGIEAPFMGGRVPATDTTLIQNSFLSNTEDVDVTPPRSVNGSSNLSPMTLNIQSSAFAHPSTSPQNSRYDVSMTYIVSDSLGTSNFSVPQDIYVTNYSKTISNKFQVYYVQNHPSGGFQLPLILGYEMFTPGSNQPADSPVQGNTGGLSRISNFTVQALQPSDILAARAISVGLPRASTLNGTGKTPPVRTITATVPGWQRGHKTASSLASAHLLAKYMESVGLSADILDQLMVQDWMDMGT
jgi:hypothetical protein